MQGHLTPAELEAPDRLTTARRVHLHACPRCRVQARLLGVFLGGGRTAAPPADCLGPYRLGPVLGRGGMGLVFRATHQATGSEVALKTVAAGGPALLGALRREISALAAVRHPGVVRTLEHGVDDRGVPWVALELVDGRTLRSLLGGTGPSEAWWSSALNRAPDAPVLPRVELRPLLAVLAEVCDALAHLHGEGIVHRDLKPDNIVVRDDGHPVIVDFGLAARSHTPRGGEPEAQEPASGGTAAYMAPEQIAGVGVDARSDLYALGCMLYEVIAGRPPFLGDDVLAGHLHGAPEPPSHARADGDDRLDALTLRLLAKRPGDRPGYAADVAAELRRTAELPAPTVVDAPRPYLYRSDLVGREALLDALATRFDGPPSVVVLTGESGVGKTRLLRELGHEAGRRGMPVLRVACRAQGPPLGGFVAVIDAIADRCRIEGEARTRAVLASEGPVLAEAFACLASLPGLGAPPPKLPPRKAQRRLLVALAAVLARHAEGRPVLLVDDVHLADALTVALLVGLADGSLGLHAAVVAGLRSDAPTAHLAPLLEHPDVAALRVPRLGPSEIGEVLRGMLAVDGVPEPVAAEVHTRSAGNPLFTGEILRTAIAEGHLGRSADGRWSLDVGLIDALRLPASVLSLVARRLDGLAGPDRAVARLAAIAGRQVDEDLLAHLAEREVTVELARLVAREVLEEADDGLVFCHDRLREVAVEGLDEGERLGLHRRAARWLDALPPAQRQARLAELSRHWERAGQRDRAARTALEGARHAASGVVVDAADALYRRFFGLQPDAGVERLEIELEHVELLHHADRLEAAREAALQTLARATALGHDPFRARALFWLGNCAMVAGEAERAASWSVAALEAAEGEAPVVVSARLVLGRALLQQGRIDDARREAMRALDRLGAGRSVHRGRALTLLADTLYAAGRVDEVEALETEALELFLHHGELHAAGCALNNLAEHAVNRGDLDLAARRLGEAIDLHRRAGSRRSAAIAGLNLGVLVLERGDPEAACACMGESVDSLGALGLAAHQATARMSLATAQLAAGHGEAAIGELRLALETQEGLGQRGQAAHARVLLARALRLVRGGDLECAESSARQALQAAGELGSTVVEGLAWCELGHLALARGQSAGAALAEASPRLEGTGEVGALKQLQQALAAIDPA